MSDSNKKYIVSCTYVVYKRVNSRFGVKVFRCKIQACQRLFIYSECDLDVITIFRTNTPNVITYCFAHVACCIKQWPLLGYNLFVEPSQSSQNMN